jgi:AraC-like DNA-binding protein
MAVELRLKPVERVVFRSDIAGVAQFRCPSTDPLFRDSGPCSNHAFVFPRTTGFISRADGTRFVGSPNTVSFYNQHDEYRREPEGPVSACDFYVVADDVLTGAIAAFDPAVHDRYGQPFRFAFAPVNTSVYVAQRQILNRLAVCAAPDPLGVDESILGILDAVLAGAYGAPTRPASGRVRDAVDEAQRSIGRTPTRNVKLRDLAAASGVSPFELCRAFARITGLSMTDYRNSLRIRLALDRIRDPHSDLGHVALELGFSSHSHFTSVFRRHTGMTPSAYRSTNVSSGMERRVSSPGGFR